MAVRSGSSNAGKRITGKKNVRQAIQAQTRLTSVTIICTCIIAQKGIKMKGYWIVTIIQKKAATYAPNEWLTREWELHCKDLAVAQGTFNTLRTVWPSDRPPMEVKIEWHEVEPNADTIPDTDFMEGGDS